MRRLKLILVPRWPTTRTLRRLLFLWRCCGAQNLAGDSGRPLAAKGFDDLPRNICRFGMQRDRQRMCYLPHIRRPLRRRGRVSISSLQRRILRLTLVGACLWRTNREAVDRRADAIERW